jgi:hypothetical protein
MDIQRLLSSGSFDSEMVQVITTAHKRACAALHVDWGDPFTEVIARKIIARAKRGERDPVRLCASVVNELRSNPKRTTSNRRP